MNFPRRFFEADSISYIAIKRSTNVPKSQSAHFSRPSLDIADLVGCVFTLVAVTPSKLPDVSAEEVLHSRHVADPDIILEPPGPSSQALTLFGGARFIAWNLKCHFFRGMTTEPDAFLRMSSVLGLRPFVWAQLKKKAPCLSHPFGGVCCIYSRHRRTVSREHCHASYFRQVQRLLTPNQLIIINTIKSPGISTTKTGPHIAYRPTPHHRAPSKQTSHLRRTYTHWHPDS